MEKWEEERERRREKRRQEREESERAEAEAEEGPDMIPDPDWEPGEPDEPHLRPVMRTSRVHWRGASLTGRVSGCERPRVSRKT